MNPSIGLSGGIGNQLFQWTAAHFLFDGSVFNLNLGHYQINPEREFELGPILEFCTHANHNESKLGFNKLAKYFEWAAAKGTNSFLLESLGFFQESTFDLDAKRKIKMRKKLGAPVIVEGLFQDSSIVDAAWPYMGSELIYTLKQTYESTKIRLGLPQKYVAVHVRRGDYPISTGPSHAIGQLNDDFFIEIALEFDLPIILLTENANEVEGLRKVLKSSLVISNSEANPLQALSILANSQSLVGSNSSLSWWGAFLVSKLGKLSILPENWSQWENYENPKLKNELIHFAPSKWKLL